MLTPNVSAGDKDVAARIAYIEEMGAALAEQLEGALEGAEPIERLLG